LTVNPGSDEDMNDEGMASIDPALLQRIRMNDELAQAMGGFHLRGWNAVDGVIDAGFTVQRQHCHSEGRIAQGGFITGWLDAAMAFAVILQTEGQQTVNSLEIKVSFYEKVGPGAGHVQARVVRRGRRVAFLEASLFNAEGKLAAQASSTGILVDYRP
jgi:uncharacterized protein (TIGR00369 family)